jgi:hypothetical protein
VPSTATAADSRNSRDTFAFARVHRESLLQAAPVLTVVGAQLTTPGLMVEIEVDAIIGQRAPANSGDNGL